MGATDFAHFERVVTTLVANAEDYSYEDLVEGLLGNAELFFVALAIVRGQVGK